MTKLSASLPRAIAVVALLCLTAASPAAAERYLVVFDQHTPTPDLNASALRSDGARVLHDLPELGLAVVESSDPTFPARLEARQEIVAVGRDVRRPLSRGADAIPLAARSEAGRSGSIAPFNSPPTDAPPVTADDLNAAQFLPLQWSLRKSQVDQAWAVGALGDPRVTVAIISSGLDYTHPELAGRIDLDRSVNLRPDDAAQVEQLYPGAHPIADLGLHGSYVASIITCNAFAQACYAPNATLVGIKALDFEEKGSAGDLAAALHYAAQIRADIVVLPENLRLFDPRDPDDRAAIFALKRATLWAKLRGSLVLAAAWPTVRNAVGEDADANSPLLHMPAEAGAMVVGGTGTEDQWSGANDFGFSLIDIAAPGGQVDLETGFFPPNVNMFQIGVCSSFTQFQRGQPFFDFPAICNKQQPPMWILWFGPRMAVAEAAGTAALIDSKFGGALPGLLVRWQLLRTSDDILDPGRDPFSGPGRINALRAVTE